MVVIGVVGIGHRQPADAEMGAEGRPVDDPVPRHEDEHVVLLTPSDDEGLDDLGDVDPADLGRLVDVTDAAELDHTVLQARRGRRPGRLRVHHERRP